MQCNYYNVSIRVLQQYVKTQHLGNFTTSDLYYNYNRFSQLGKSSVYHTPRRSRLQFYDVIFSLVIIRLSRSLTATDYGNVISAVTSTKLRSQGKVTTL